MSKKQFKSQASSSRAVSGSFGSAEATFGSSTFGVSLPLGGAPLSLLSYVAEPPDLGGISEPNIVVAFKNLQKKDSTTKSKALEDLQSYILSLTSDRAGVEDAVLEAWVGLHEELPFVLSRRVRQLAHGLQGQISLSCGKRMAKHMPKVVGAWLAGLYDNDRIVARTADESYKTMFPSQEKRNNVWKVYQTSILEYCKDAILKETSQTLSDERTTSLDDAEAKYSRVVGTAILVVSNALDIVQAEDRGNQEDSYEELLGQDHLWKFSSHQDAFVRKAVYRLFIVVLKKQKQDVNLALISPHLLTDSLRTDQSGSAYDYIKSLACLALRAPEVWTQYLAGSGKKSPQRNLCRFLQKGSQGGPPDFWNQIAYLLRHAPHQTITPEDKQGENSSNKGEISHPFLEALREGIARKDEPKSNQHTAWQCYLDVFERVLSSTSNSHSRHSLVNTSVVPIIEQYLKPDATRSTWTTSGLDQRAICLKALLSVSKVSKDLFDMLWRRFSNTILQDLQASLPAQSKDYIKSQDLLGAMATRWYNLVAALFEGKDGIINETLVEETLSHEIEIAAKTLADRNGKPYGAAVALEIAVRAVPKLTLHVKRTKECLTEFADRRLVNLLLSASSTHLINLLGLLTSCYDTDHIYSKSLQNLREAPTSAEQSKALENLVRSPWLNSPNGINELGSVVTSNLHQALNGDNNGWNIVTSAFQNWSTPPSLTSQLLTKMTESLSIEDQSAAGLHGLDLSLKSNEKAVEEFSASSQGSALLSRLLFLADSTKGNESEQAKKISDSIETLLLDGKTSNKSISSILDVINTDLESTGPTSLSIELLVEQAQKVIRISSQGERPHFAAELLPTLSHWTDALQPHLEIRPNLSLAITSPFGSAINMFENLPSSYAARRFVSRDADGYSTALRLALYTAELINETEIFESLTIDQKAVTCRYLALMIQLANDNLSVAHANYLWHQEFSSDDGEVADAISKWQALLVFWLRSVFSPGFEFVRTAQEQLLADSRGSSIVSYYSARAYMDMTLELAELGPSQQKYHASQLPTLQGEFTFDEAASVACCDDSERLLKFCNQLIANLTSRDLNIGNGENLRHLVFLNIAVRKEENIVQDIAQQRLVFFARHIVSSISGNSIPVTVFAEASRVLQVILPSIKDIYGSFWAGLVDTLISFWSQHLTLEDDKINAIHACLRLCETLRKLSFLDPNDDFQDAWMKNKPLLADCFLELLKEFADQPDESHQPRKIVNQLLARLILSLPREAVRDAKDLYPVLTSESSALQQSAYEILHLSIPTKQEQISLDAALSKEFTPKLPEELLSLILTTPSLDSTADASFQSTMPATLRGYLLSWILVFDHWTNASYKIQASYVECVKEGIYLTSLLNLISNSLVNSRLKPVDASKFEIESYLPGSAETTEKDVQWILIHLYYLSLKRLPSLSRSWWRDDISRQTLIAVESWTEKYFSPLITSSELSTVTSWIPSQLPDDQPLTVKVSLRTRQITASIPIDEQTMSIAICLPETYPLHTVSVESVQRIGVDEKKWRSWIINTQGVINFSNGSLIDGLLTWKRNVTGMLKGQSECAICYSVVGSDRSLPSKRCGTCKNLFHGVCLYRWFKSSNSSSCPLCRNAFNYG